MGSYSHLLVKILLAQINNNGRSLGRGFDEDYMNFYGQNNKCPSYIYFLQASHFNGLLLEDLKFTTPLPQNMDGEINPLVKLLYGGDKSQFRICRLQDHLARIEMKVEQLESRVPYCLEQRLLVGAAEVDDDDYDSDDEDGESRKKSSNKQPSSNKGSNEKGNDQKGKDQKGKDGKEERKGSHQKTKEQKRRKKEDENCFARLLFSKCWSGNQGKNSKAGWNVKNCCYKTGRVKKGACPAYSTCPCGEDAPCAKIDKKPCPANQKKSGGAGSGESGSGGKGKKKEGEEGSKNKKSDKKNTDENPLSALCGKLCNGPCIFSRKGGEHGEGKSSGWCGSCHKKKHVHTPCCCRCKDNPALGEKEKSKQSFKSGSNQSNKKASAPPQKKPKESNVSFEDDDLSVHSAIIFQNKDGKDPTQEPVRCVGCTDCDDIRRGSRQGTIHMIMNEEKMKMIEDKKQRGETKTTEENTEVLSKSSTNFQVLLPPTISSESSDNNMVSHQILKTLSTIHGPIRVEQKILVKGTKNAFVIVTHGEACECKICSTLKKDGVADRKVNDKPTVVRFPTDNGGDTLVNHSDNCQCTICSVLEQGITEETPNAGMDKCQSSGALSSLSRNDLKTTIDQNSDSDEQDSKTDRNKKYESKSCSTSGIQNDVATSKKLSRKNKEEYRKKKCHCLNCVKRRKDKRLKKRLKRVLEPSAISQVLMDLSHHGFTLESTPTFNEDDDGDDDDGEDTSEGWSASSKRVSFSRDTKVRRYGDAKSSGNSVSKETVVPGRNDREQLTLTTKTAGSDRKRKRKGSKGAKPSSQRKDNPEQFNIMPTSPLCKHSKIPLKPCGCIICKFSDVTSRGATLSKIVHHRPDKDEEQKCFPEKTEVPSKCGCKKDTCTDESDQLRETLLDEVIYPDDDFIRPPTRCEPGCKGRCRYLTPRDKLNDLGKNQTIPVVLQASSERIPPKVLYWIPSSPNLAAAFSSDSYYIPDLDEFPAGRDQSNTHSSEQNSSNSKPEPGSSCDFRKSRTAKVKRSHGSSER